MFRNEMPIQVIEANEMPIQVVEANKMQVPIEDFRCSIWYSFFLSSSNG